MKQKHNLMYVMFMLWSFFHMSQSLIAQPIKPYIQQAGIKKKISELLKVKPEPIEPYSVRDISRLRFGLRNFLKLKHNGPANLIGIRERESNYKDEGTRYTSPKSAAADSFTTT